MLSQKQREESRQVYEAVKRYNENMAQAQPQLKGAPRGGVTASMIFLEPDDLACGVVFSAAQLGVQVSLLP